MKTEDYIKFEIEQGIQKWQTTNLYREIQQLHVETRRIDQKIDIKFNWFYGLMVAAIIIPKLVDYLHYLR